MAVTGSSTTQMLRLRPTHKEVMGRKCRPMDFLEECSEYFPEFFQSSRDLKKAWIWALPIWSDVYKYKTIVRLRNGQQTHWKDLFIIVKEEPLFIDFTIRMCLLSTAPRQLGKLAHGWILSDIFFHNSSYGTGRHTITSLLHRIWQTRLIILATDVTPSRYE
jgi:hypothetical protein